MKRPNRGTAGLSFGGFTLIEVMITVAVIAILAAVALPNYIEYVTRSKLVEAKTNLSDMRTRLEQYFLDNRDVSGSVRGVRSGRAAGEHDLPAGKHQEFRDHVPHAHRYDLHDPRRTGLGLHVHHRSDERAQDDRRAGRAGRPRLSAG